MAIAHCCGPTLSMKPIESLAAVLVGILVLAMVQNAAAQDNFEIQVYGAETVRPGTTMVESHSNFTFKGSDQQINGVLPTDHAFHETIEITHGITSWSELGFYLFTSAESGYGVQWVGDHIRPRVRAPEEWGWPIGASLSAEIGYQQRTFSVDTWSAEIRPIIDWRRNGLYVSFNPTFDLSLHGETAGSAPAFSPNAKISMDITSTVTFGVEYYGSLGSVTSISPWQEQQQQIFPSIDLNLSPEWEFNCGLGFGMTPSTDRTIFKMIVGRRFGG